MAAFINDPDDAIGVGLIGGGTVASGASREGGEEIARIETGLSALVEESLIVALFHDALRLMGRNASIPTIALIGRARRCG